MKGILQSLEEIQLLLSNFHTLLFHKMHCHNKSCVRQVCFQVRWWTINRMLIRFSFCLWVENFHFAGIRSAVLISLASPLGKSYCGFVIRLYSLKNHTCGIFLKSPGYEIIKNNDPCCQIQCLNFKFWAGVVLRIWLKQGKEKRLLARILKFLEKARKRLSRQNSTKKCVNVRGKSPLCENREHC